MSVWPASTMEPGGLPGRPRGAGALGVRRDGRVVTGAGGGRVVTAAGAAVLLGAFAQFALEGRGTPAPPAPTGQLVVRGAQYEAYRRAVPGWYPRRPARTASRR